MPLAYKKHLRRNMLQPLKALAESSGPLTTQELASVFEDRPALRTEITKHFASLRHWALIEEATPRKYRVTVRGMRFIDGFEAVPEWGWTVNNEPVATPEGEEPAPLRHIWEIEPKDFSEPSRHVEEAVQLCIPN